MDIEVLQRHIDDCANEIVVVRDFCGDERAVMLEYQSENGIKFNPLECVHIASTVDSIWGCSQAAAGVVAPLSTSERLDAYKALE